MMKRSVVLAATVGMALSAGALALAGGHRPPGRTAEVADTARVTASIAFFEARLEQDPLNRTAATRLAGRYVQRFQQSARLEDLRRAEQLARDARPLSLDPVEDDARLSALMLMQHRFAEAYDFALQAVAGDPRRESAAGALFDASFATGRYSTVDSLIEAADYSSLAWQVRRAQWLDVKGESSSAASVMSGACERLERAGAPASTRAWCLVELAGFRHSSDGPVEAERILNRALRVMPGYRGALEGLADLAHAHGDWKNAHDLFVAIATDAHPDLYLRLAEVSRELDRFDEANDWELKFLDVAGQPASEPLFALPLALFLAREPAMRGAALAIARRDLERRRAVETWDVLAWIHHRRGETEQALMASDSALHWGAPSATMLYHRAAILESLGRTAEEAALMREALADPSLLTPTARLALRINGP